MSKSEKENRSAGVGAACTACGTCGVCRQNERGLPDWVSLDAGSEGAERRLEVPAGAAGETAVWLPVGPGRVTVDIGAGSSVTLVDSSVGPACMGPERTEVNLSVGEGAAVRLVSVRECSAGRRRDSSVGIRLAAGASLDAVECRFGGGDTLACTEVELAGEGASFSLRSAAFCTGDERLSLSHRVMHFAPATTSRIITSGVLGGDSRLRYRGCLEVAEAASGSDGGLHAGALLLSSAARADLEPDLRIRTDDVRCSHGTTVSGLDAEREHYLMSRGLPRTAARALAARGFVWPALSGIDDPELRAEVESILDRRLSCVFESDPSKNSQP